MKMEGWFIVPLNKSSLSSAIKSALQTSEDKTVDDTAEAIATAIDDYIRSMTITVAGVTTAGTAAAQTQVAPVTAVIN
jgi:hypothetical protein